jgi:glucan endo-1,3-alpha-glucosidase
VRRRCIVILLDALVVTYGKTLVAMLLLAAAWTLAACYPAAAAAQPDIPPNRMVFAAYMVCCPFAGDTVTVDDFLADIRAAHDAGIDGFVLDCGEWNNAPRYKRNSAMLFEAARRFGPDFKLFFMADQAGAKMGFYLSADEAADMIARYRDHPNLFRYQGRPVMTTFLGEPDWFEDIRTKVRKTTGEDVFLVPSFYPAGDKHEVPTANGVAALIAQSDKLDGYAYFGAAGAPDALADAIRRQAEAWSSRGKLFMAGIAPYYRGLRGNYRVFENNGYQGLIAQWMAAIQSNTSWVELVTWNDWSEDTYFSPLGKSGKATHWTELWGYLLAHDGFLGVNRYFSEWFKTGHRPPIDRDQVFYAYRLQRRYAPGLPDPQRPQIGWPMGAFELNDQVNILGLLRAPAEIVLGHGPAAATASLGAGMSTTALPMQSGPVSLAVVRGGTTIGAKTGELPISVMDGWSNFNMLAGEIPITDNASPPQANH